MIKFDYNPWSLSTCLEQNLLDQFLNNIENVPPIKQIKKIFNNGTFEKKSVLMMLNY